MRRWEPQVRGIYNIYIYALSNSHVLCSRSRSRFVLFHRFILMCHFHFISSYRIVSSLCFRLLYYHILCQYLRMYSVLRTTYVPLCSAPSSYLENKRKNIVYVCMYARGPTISKQDLPRMGILGEIWVLVLTVDCSA